ncbi:unnamed protein product [[Actinomadura] parvosata subsp. kistnae]|nr:unnamed protein product [Actinomadura parvosata subsp. kistnae]
MITFDPEHVRLLVRDDGEGFAHDGTESGYGLAGMRARDAEIDGTLRVDSRPGEGTAVEVRVPGRARIEEPADA